MVTVRENTLVVNLSILPKRPEPSVVEQFMYGELKLDLADVTNIQFHNVRNVVFVEMVDAATAQQYHNDHHLRHVIKIDGQEFKIPVYVEDDAINVRVHDLPPRTANAVLKEHLQHFGTILSISREKWKNYFLGVYNGVRVVRMRLTKPIPSYQTIDGETTLVTYPNQPKTCRFCELKSHPRQKCSTSKKSTTTTNTINPTPSASFAAKDFPPIGDGQQKQKQKQQKQISAAADPNIQQQQQSSNNNTSDEDAQHTDSDSDDCLTSNNKRRLSIRRADNEIKRKNANQEDDQKKANEMDVELDNDERDKCEPTPTGFSTVVTRSKQKN